MFWAVLNATAGSPRQVTPKNPLMLGCTHTLFRSVFVCNLYLCLSACVCICICVCLYLCLSAFVSRPKASHSKESCLAAHTLVRKIHIKKEIKDYVILCYSNAVHNIQCESAHYPAYCYSETSNPWPSGFCNNKCTILAKPIVIRQNQNPAQSKC